MSPYSQEELRQMLGRRLQKERKRKQMTAAEVADATGVDPKVYEAAEAGQEMLGIRDLTSLADLFDLDGAAELLRFRLPEEED